MGFSLRAGVTFCHVGDRTIFLDILADRYFCLSKAAERSFMSILDGGNPTCEDEHVDGLVARGLLVPTADPALPRPCEPIPLPQQSLLDQKLPPPGLIGMAGAGWRLASVQVRLKLMGLGRTLAWLSARKAVLSRADVRSDQRVELIMANFAAAARFVSQLDNCLSHSLAVASQMIAQGLSPEIVLGVQLGPFSAHCWVQHDDRLVNDRVDMVRTFTPILRI